MIQSAHGENSLEVFANSGPDSVSVDVVGARRGPISDGFNNANNCFNNQ
jgi:hypothetical protein